MKIKIKMRCKEFIKLSVPFLAASRPALRFSTPSGHHLQARKVGRRIQSLRAFRRAWDLGSRALGEGAFSEDT